MITTARPLLNNKTLATRGPRPMLSKRQRSVSSCHKRSLGVHWRGCYPRGITKYILICYTQFYWTFSEIKIIYTKPGDHIVPSPYGTYTYNFLTWNFPIMLALGPILTNLDQQGKFLTSQHPIRLTVTNLVIIVIHLDHFRVIWTNPGIIGIISINLDQWVKTVTIWHIFKPSNTHLDPVPV